MARAPQISLKSPAHPTNNNSSLFRAALIKVNSDGTIKDTTPESYFLLNPSSWEESKSSNWIQQQVPGQSDPIQQWTSGGPRIVTFDALVTRDSSDFKRQKTDLLENITDKAVAVVGEIASSFAGVNIPAADLIGNLLGIPSQGEGEDLSIDSYLNYYRSLLYPTYKGSILSSSPPLVILYNGKTFNRTAHDAKITAKDFLWVITNIKIRITKQLPNLTPMEAIVNFQLTEYVLFSRDASIFQVEGPSSSSAGSTALDFIKGLF